MDRFSVDGYPGYILPVLPNLSRLSIIAIAIIPDIMIDLVNNNQINSIALYPKSDLKILNPPKKLDKFVFKFWGTSSENSVFAKEVILALIDGQYTCNEVVESLDVVGNVSVKISDSLIKYKHKSKKALHISQTKNIEYLTLDAPDIVVDTENVREITLTAIQSVHFLGEGKYLEKIKILGTPKIVGDLNPTNLKSIEYDENADISEFHCDAKV